MKWAIVALDNTGRACRAQTGLARPIGFALFPTYAEDEWFRHTNFAKSVWRISAAFRGLRRMGILHGVDLGLPLSCEVRRG